MAERVRVGITGRWEWSLRTASSAPGGAITCRTAPTWWGGCGDLDASAGVEGERSFGSFHRSDGRLPGAICCWSLALLFTTQARPFFVAALLLPLVLSTFRRTPLPILFVYSSQHRVCDRLWCVESVHDYLIGSVTRSSGLRIKDDAMKLCAVK